MYFHDKMAASALLHKEDDKQKMFKRKGKVSQVYDTRATQYYIIMNPKQLKTLDSDCVSYGFGNVEQSKKFIKKNKLHVVTFDEYLYKIKGDEWNDEIEKWGKTDIVWPMLGAHTKSVVTIMSTFAFVVASWNMKIFHRIFPWITIALGTQLLTVLWFKYNSFSERNNFIFFKEKIQMLRCNFAIFTLILFMAFSQKK